MAISLLLPVVSTIQPNLLESAMSTLPRMRAWRFSSAMSGSAPSNSRREHLVERRRAHGSIGIVQRPMPRFGESLGVGDAALARVARRHGDAVHVLGAERVDGDGGDERRVDAAREADDHVGEAVLVDVVAGAEHERLVDLVPGVSIGSTRGRRRARRCALAHLDSGSAAPARPAGRAAACGTSAARRGRRPAGPRRTAGAGRRARPCASKTSDAPSKTSSSWPPTWLT